MSDFDDEEYESFELDGTGRRAAPRRPTGPVTSGETAPDEDDELDDDDLDDDLEDPDDGDEDDEDGDEEEDDEDEDDDEGDDDLEDAAEDEIDFVLAAYREDGQPFVQALAKDLANDLDELIVQLRRLPGDAGALGFVSLVEEVFVLVRVRGPHVKVLLSDGTAAGDWPIARDVADYLGEEIPDDDEDEDAEPMGDLGILSDLGLSDFDMAAIIDNLDLSSDQMLIEIAGKIKLNPQFRRVAEAAFG